VILNISTYKFVTLQDLPALQPKILAQCRAQNLKGTILLAEEGINMFLAGQESEIHAFFDWLRQDPRFANIVTKDSWSEQQPFKKMIVRIKREIIRMDHPTIRPDHAERSPYVSAETLKHWLDQGHDDQGKPVVLLDTRNAFEVRYGTFDTAIDYNISKFSELPDVLKQHQNELQDKTVVSFCTGGIRCEKVGILMQEIGIKNSYQLDGGILKYFEIVGNAHYHGSCFVFDEREALDPGLHAV
jgi:UPF0176 protein